MNHKSRKEELLSMENFPCIEASFIISGIYFNLEEFTKEIEIIPTKTRGLEDWPKAIKNTRSIPKELQPRYIWSISEKMELCKQIELPINKIISNLSGKEQKIMEFCKNHNLIKSLNVAVHGEVMELPEMVLPSDSVYYFGNLRTEISFDIYAY